MRAPLLTLLLVLGGPGGAWGPWARPAEAADDALKAWTQALERLADEEAREAAALDKRLRDALAARRKIRFDFRNGSRSHLDDCDDELRVVFAPFLAREERAAAAARTLASSGAKRAAETLWDALQKAALAADALDVELVEAHPVAEAMIYDQARAFRRSAAARRETALLEAFARAPGADEILGPATWRALDVADGRRGVVRRRVFLDAAGLLPPPSGIAALVGGLGSDEPCLRMAALEAAARQGPSAEPVLRGALRDAHVLVRRAALAGLRALAPHEGASLADALVRLEPARDAERAEVLATLRVLAGRDLGAEPAAWTTWIAAHAADVAAGRFDARKQADAGAETVAPPAPGPALLGVELGSDSVVFVCDWTIPMTTPADVAFARTRKRIDWFGGDSDWVGKDGQERLQTVVRRELGRTLAALPGTARFGLVVLRDGNRDPWPRIVKDGVLGVPRLLAPDRASIARVDETLGDVPPGWSRWHETLDGIWHAATVAGARPDTLDDLPEPRADTIVVVSSGEVRGGRFLLPEESVAAFARWNRFRRFVVHTIRVADDGRDADTLLRGFATASGGRSTHLQRAP